MTVYEAANREHYQKIAEFLESQPKDSIWLQCFQGVIAKNTADHIEFLKQQKPEFHIFVCEDGKGRIRAIGVFETRGERPNEPRILTNYLPFWDETDRQKKDYQYVKELIIWSAKYAEDNQYLYVEGIMSEPDFGLVEDFSNNFLIIQEFDSADYGLTLGKIRHYRFYPKGVPEATK